MFDDHRVTLHDSSRSPAGRQMFQDLERLGEQAVLNYNVPDAGIWELRGQKRVLTDAEARGIAAAADLQK